MPIEDGIHEDNEFLALTTRRDEMALEVQVAGRLDGASGHCLVKIVDQLTATGDTVTIDLSMVEHMDSDGAEAISRTATTIASRGSTAALTGGDPTVRRLLAQYGLAAGAASPSPTDRDIF